MAPLAPLVTVVGSFIGLAREARRHHQLRKNSAVTEGLLRNTASNTAKHTNGSLHPPSIDEEIDPKSSPSDSATKGDPAYLKFQDTNEKEPLLKPIAQDNPVSSVVYNEIDEKHLSIASPTQKEKVGLFGSNKNQTREIEPDKLAQLSNDQQNYKSGIKDGIPLSGPVILPQRRPRWKSRGFIRAYAPVLREYDIDEEQFLDFMDRFHRAAKVVQPITPLALSSIHYAHMVFLMDVR